MTTPRPILVLLAVTACSAGDPHGSDGLPPEDLAPVAGHCVAGNGSDPWADCVEDFAPAPGIDYGHDRMPGIVLGPPHGGGATGGSSDVASLGCGGRITLYFDPPALRDGPGPDFVVFENAFVTGDTTFVEPARVLVSDDGETWATFDCRLDGTWPPTGCAGIEPVYASGDAPIVDVQAAGGDAFDLADVGLDTARYVRLIDVTAEYYGNDDWCGPPAGGFDLDAVGAVGG